MTNQEIYDLIACFDRSTAQTMKLSMQDFSIELTRGGASMQSATESVQLSVQTPVAPLLSEKPEKSEKRGNLITAPIVGTYYAAASPEEAPFVKVGDHVTKGQTVCLIEAMKMMSEIEAPCDGIIEEVLQENGTLVEFGAPLLRYREV